jgi:hypothetical protein
MRGGWIYDLALRETECQAMHQHWRVWNDRGCGVRPPSLATQTERFENPHRYQSTNGGS